MNRRTLLFSLVLIPLFAVAAPVERDLGVGLVYFRIHALPVDLPARPAGRVPACVVDVRYLAANADAAKAFSVWLKQRATPRSPVFVVANADTSADVLAVLRTHGRGAGIVVVGIERGSFRPDVSVKGSHDEERRAYDAFEQGAVIGTLLADNPNKVRNDEASLSKDRLAEASAAADEAGKKTPPPVDVTLQRAVHLHRALVALKKI